MRSPRCITHVVDVALTCEFVPVLVMLYPPPEEDDEEAEPEVELEPEPELWLLDEGVLVSPPIVSCRDLSRGRLK